MNTQSDQMRIFTNKLLWTTLSIIGIFILVASFFLIVAKDAVALKKTQVEKTAVNALKLKLGDPSSLKIIDISKPDSVFINRVCPEFEAMEISQKFLEFSLNIMQDSHDDIRNSDSKAYRCKMDRYTESSAALTTLNNMLEKPEGKHCGWRVKVKYQTIDESDTPYVSEAWFIFDKDKKHILNTYEFSLL